MNVETETGPEDMTEVFLFPPWMTEPSNLFKKHFVLFVGVEKTDESDVCRSMRTAEVRLVLQALEQQAVSGVETCTSEACT